VDLGQEEGKFVEYRTEVGKRLGLLTFRVVTAQGEKALRILVKETNQNELLLTSLANKLFPYNSPRVVYYNTSSERTWLFLENLDNWVDVCDRSRVNETLVDGLYDIHQVTFMQTDTLLQHFDLPVLPGAAIYRRALTVFEGIKQNWGGFSMLFTPAVCDRLTRVTESLAELGSISFPQVLVHGNFVHNSTRGLVDARGNCHVVVYDWVNSVIGWPQADLVSLFDRIHFVAFYQNLPDPSPLLLERYMERLVEDFRVDVNAFTRVFVLCQLCNALAVMRYWMQPPVAGSDSERAFAEIRAKLYIVDTFSEKL